MRYETRNLCGVDRRSDWPVQEMVVMETEALTEQERRGSLHAKTHFAETLDPDLTRQSASDPFFATAPKAIQIFNGVHDLSITRGPYALSAEDHPEDIGGPRQIRMAYPLMNHSNPKKKTAHMPTLGAPGATTNHGLSELLPNTAFIPHAGQQH